ncbi:prepilin-type N-terminal cleavage/methylation domain-containing protein [Thermus parvatiensis]|nr:prepilin-type N-terminal cleavage/methylation domain-containing protein [Thermus parvatiensis]
MRKGLTLIEVLVALVILSAVLLGLSAPLGAEPKPHPKQAGKGPRRCRS